MRFSVSEFEASFLDVAIMYRFLSRASQAAWSVAAPKVKPFVAASAVAFTASALCTSQFVKTEEYESCDVIGDGLRAEFWKAKVRPCMLSPIVFVCTTITVITN